MRDRQASRWFDLNNVYQYRNNNLARMGFKSYASYLRSPLWKSIRARVLAAYPTCIACFRAPSTQVHHRAYDPKTLAGEELRSLSAVCAKCHKKAERPGHHRPSVDRLLGANAVIYAPSRRRRKLVAKAEEKHRMHAMVAPMWSQLPKLVIPD